MGSGASSGKAAAPADGKAEEKPRDVPAVIFQGFQEGVLDDTAYDKGLMTKVKVLLELVPSLGPERLQVIEIRDEGSKPSLLEPLLSAEEFTKSVRVVSNGEAAAQSCGGRAMVFGGNLEKMLYTVHALKQEGRAQEVGVCSQMCKSSTRSGALPRTSLISHMEEVLGAKVLCSISTATSWLLPDGPTLPEEAASTAHAQGIQLKVESKDDTKLTPVQEELIRLVLETNVASAHLKKLGKGWSHALKFFCTPTVEVKGVMATGAMCFIKMGPENEVHEELDITKRMMQLIGNFCPQIMGYAEAEDQACIVTTIANMGSGPPQGLADLWERMLAAAGTEECDKLVSSLEKAISFVFGTLMQPLYSGSKVAEPFSFAEEIGLTYDVSEKDPKSLPEHQVSSWWVLRMSWTRWGGDGKLQSSLLKRAAALVGEEAAAGAELTLCGVTLPNVCQKLLKDTARLTKLRDLKKPYPVCMVHGDLHGDNIMVDSKDNSFVIDFGKTGLGNALEDFAWLETYLLMAYPNYSDAEFEQMLTLVQPLADNLLPKALAKGLPLPDPDLPTVKAIRGVMRGMRDTLSKQIALMRADDEDVTYNLVATLLLLRNALMQFVFPHNDGAPLRAKLGLALACGYAEVVEKILDAVPA